MNEEQNRILKLLENGKITSEQAAKLLQALNGAANTRPGAGGPTKFLKIRVYEGDLNKPKVRVNVPISLVKIATKFIPQDKGTITINDQTINIKDLDIDELIASLKEGEAGKIVEVEDDNERVEIFIE